MRGLLALLLVASVARAATDPYPRIWSYRWNAADGGPFITVSGSISAAPVATIPVRDRSRWMLNTWTDGPWGAVRGTNRHDVIDTVLNYKPTGRQLMYLQLQNWYRDSTWAWPATDSTFNATYGQAIQDYKAYMYGVGAYGSLYTYNVNWGKRAFASYFRAKLCDALKQGRWSGVFFDYYVPRPSGFNDGSRDLDIAHAGYWYPAQMDSAFATNLSDMRDTLKLVFGSGFKVMGNVASWGEYAKTESVLTVHPLDGRLREGIAYIGGPSPGTSNIPDTTLWFVRQSSPEYKLLKMEGGDGNNPYGATVRNAARYLLGQACMGDGWAWVGGGVSGSSDAGHTYWTGFQDEFSVNIVTLDADTTGAHTGWLGQPIGGAVMVEGNGGIASQKNSTGLWVRYFEHGAVVVNTGALATRTFTFPFPKAAYKFIRGVTETGINTGGDARTVTVNQQDAVFVIGETPR